ncbi:hypothetical protein OG562_27960 [Streptomyces sp. NBC_01275]|nr:hypothetical protein [Streptomyces sp. NBC_01275]
MTSGADAPVAIKEPAPAVSAVSAVSALPAAEDETSGADLVLPLVAVGAVGVAAGYGYVRRVRRARRRTTPGGVGSPPPRAASPPLAGLDERACAALVEADDRLRAARAELGFAEALFGPGAVTPFRRATRDAENELAAAFRMRQRYDEGVPAEEAERRHALAGIVGRCVEAGRRLDAVAGDFDRLRGLEGQGVDAALGVAEARFRELAGRTGAVDAVLAGLGARYAPTASAAVTGSVEQAKDRLLFATVRLNQARQAADSGQPERAARQLRAAEGAVAQAAVLVEGVDRLAGELREAEGLVAAALTGAEAELADARGRPDAAEGAGGEGKDPGAAARLPHADAVLAAVRQESTGRQPGDPIGVLRRIVRATAPLASGRAGVLAAAGLVVARSSTAAAADFVTTHRGAVSATPRTRLAEAERLLAAGDPTTRAQADTLALEALELSERDVRAHGNPYTGSAGAGRTTAGTGGAVLGGVVPADDPENGPPAGFGRPTTPG